MRAQALRFQDVLLDEGRQRLAGNLLDHNAEQDRVGVGIVEVAAGRKQRRMAEGDLQQLARRPLPEGLLRHLRIGVVGVVVEPAAHRRKLPERDLVAARHALDIAVDRVVETKLALVRQHENGRDREGLAVAADAHVEIGCHLLAGRRIAHAERPHIRLAVRLARCRRWRRESMRAAWRAGLPCPTRRPARPRNSPHSRSPSGVRSRARPRSRPQARTAMRAGYSFFRGVRCGRNQRSGATKTRWGRTAPRTAPRRYRSRPRRGRSSRRARR